MAYMALALALCMVGICHGVKDDISTGVPEKDWFRAVDHLSSLNDFCDNWEGARCLHMFDLFSFSRCVSSRFERAGYRTQSFDIKTHWSQDLLAKAGFLLALGIAMEFHLLCLQVDQVFVFFVSIKFLGHVCFFLYNFNAVLKSGHTHFFSSPNPQRLCDDALFMVAPPCSLFVAISSSIHRRQDAG